MVSSTICFVLVPRLISWFSRLRLKLRIRKAGDRFELKLRLKSKS